MVRANDLWGLCVLVTRPSQQAEQLANLIEAAGGRALRAPTIEILPPRDTTALVARVSRLPDFDLAIFVSTNAVEKGMAVISAAHASFPDNVTVACVGAASARELRRFSISAIVPISGFDSEGLLVLPELKQVAGKSIVIFRGEGGRELLGETLMQRGADVEYAECYRRAKPGQTSTALLRTWQGTGIDIITATSVEGLRNLVDLIGQDQRKALTNIPIVVISQRMADVCRDLGFEADILIASQASDDAIVEAIKTWRRP